MRRAAAAPDPSLRRLEEEEARLFRERHGGSGEALYYLRNAISGLERVGASLPDTEKDGLALLREAASALEAGENEAARDVVARANALSDGWSYGFGFARKHCVRALAAAERSGSKPPL